MSILRAQHVRAVGELARPHAAEEVEVLRRRSGRGTGCRPRLGDGAAVLADLLLARAVHVRLARARSAARRTHRAARSSRDAKYRFSPQSKPEPAHVVAGSTRRTAMSSVVGLVSSKRRWQRAAVLAREAEVEADRLGVADVQVAVGLGRKARDHGPGLPAADVVRDDGADEVEPFALGELGGGLAGVGGGGVGSGGVHGRVRLWSVRGKPRAASHMRNRQE